MKSNPTQAVLWWCVAIMAGCGVAQANEAIDRAMASVRDATPRAESDPSRPIYHFRAPANWMNDPNGPIYYGGYYHMFYQHNPYGDGWGHMHWGHARSRDLAHWEHLPIALWPSKERGEDHCFSGCATVGADGKLMIFYTSIGYGKSAEEYAEQWAAVSEGECIEWKKHPASPVLKPSIHGGQMIHDWRDPFVFEEGGRTFMVLGGNLNQRKGGEAVVLLYRAENKELTDWKYMGVLFQHPDAKVVNIECPNFFKLEKDGHPSERGEWVLVVSPHGRVEYFTGRFDAEAGRFDWKTRGLVDHSGQYYAPNCLLDPNGRRIMWGWVRGFKEGLGWNGCLTLPRVLSLSANGELLQRPAVELEKLRGERFVASDVELNGRGEVLKGLKGDSLEILAEIEPGDARSVGLDVRRSEDGQRSVRIRYQAGELNVAGTKVPVSLAEGERLRLQLFLDRSVLEVYVNGGATVTRVIDAPPADLGVGLVAEGGRAVMHSIQVWPMKSIIK